MKNSWWKIAVVVGLVIVVGVVIAGKNTGKNGGSASVSDPTTTSVPSEVDRSSGSATAEDKPAVAELQSTKTSEADSGTSDAKVKVNKQTKQDESSQKPVQEKSVQVSHSAKPAIVKKVPVKLPKLVDLGATKCIPCKMMAPILEGLAKQYKGQLEVQFIDVWENRGEGEKYGIKSIPTQIFYDAKGKELFRHEGFFAKEDILAKFEEYGIKLPK